MPWTHNPVYSQIHRDEMVAAYLGGKTTTEAGAIYGASGECVRKELIRRGIPARKGNDAFCQLTVDPTRFADIVNEEDAYVLGFVAADGWITNNLTGFGVCLAERDFKQVVRIGEYLRWTGKPRFFTARSSVGTVHPSVEIRVNSAQLVANLVRQGITPTKSMDLQPWEGPPDLQRHWWRGLFDGDGAIFHSPKGWVIHLCGTWDIVQGFSRYARAIVGRPGHIYRTPGVWNVKWGGNIIGSQIAEYLYADSTIHLERKKALADEARRYVPSHRRPGKLKDVSPDMLEQDYKELGSFVQVAIKYGVTPSAVEKKIKRVRSQ